IALAGSMLAAAQDSTMNTTRPIGSAQLTTPQLRTPMAIKTRFGIKGGVNMAMLSAKEFVASAKPETNNKTSYYAGAFVNIPLGAMLKLQPELVFSSQGSKMQETVTTTGGSRTFNYEEDLDYLNLPVMFQLQTPGGFVVETGPQFSYLIDAKQKGTSPISTSNETDLDPYRDNFDIAWAVGVGYISRIGLGINARYNYGIRNIVQENDVNIGELRNRVLQFGLSYQFGANK
ncbi:MAG TPA: porin family protein, partial [Chitinophagaceae bacterium]|nr:porin family protein [Chitinophagaceae bacterium]